MPPKKYLALAIALISPLGSFSASETIQVTVSNEPIAELDPRMFGQFLERPSWGEHGPEEAADEHGQLPPKIVAMLREMEIPIVRWPGGIDVDYTDWTDMIDNAPNRSAERPATVGHTGETVTNRLGYDEYFELADQLGWASILPVNLLDGVHAKKPVNEAAMHAAGLVAYCNAPVGAKLPEGMPDWPAIRAQNGHPKPFDVEYFQLGNETWIGGWKKNFIAQFDKDDKEAMAAQYRDTAIAYIKAMKAVDPDIQIIMDLSQPGGINELVLSDPYLLENVDFVAHHIYAPMGIASKNYGPWMKGKEPVGMTSDEWELAFNSMPGQYNENGENVAFGQRLALARKLGYDVAITEWNWNGWGIGSIETKLEFEPNHSMAVGTASYLNGMIRQADQIKIATQSMLVGHSWGIAAIHYDKEDLEPIYFNAQGAVTTLYNRHHGGEVVSVETSNSPILDQPYMMGVTSAAGEVATLDVVGTKSPDALYLHIVNRHPRENAPLDIDLSAYELAGSQGQMFIMQGAAKDEFKNNGAWMNTVELSVEIKNQRAKLELPSSTVAVLKIPLNE